MKHREILWIKNLARICGLKNLARIYGLRTFIAMETREIFQQLNLTRLDSNKTSKDFIAMKPREILWIKYLARFCELKSS